MTKLRLLSLRSATTLLTAIAISFFNSNPVEQPPEKQRLTQVSAAITSLAVALKFGKNFIALMKIYRLS